MELEGAIGRKAKLSLDDGTCIEGFVHSVSASSGKITLEKVECFENGKRKKLVGLQHYFAEEITDIILTEDVCKNKKKTKMHERGGGGNGGMLKGKQASTHLNRLEFVEPSTLILKNQKCNDALTSSGNDTGGSDSDMDLPQSDGYTVIPKLCNTFYEAIAYIMKHNVIAVAMEGVVIGRFGRLCWLQIAVPDHVFLFDVLTMGRACFEEGVKDVLESKDILKVLHDCRMVSDMLHHQYDINMINVFDTQVANVFVYRLRHHNDWPRYVDGLGSCLVQHLDLPMEEVNWAVVRERRREEDEEVWTERPPQRHLVEAAVKNVKHLLDLRTVLMEKMMEEFVAGVNIYLMHVRDASDTDSKRYQTTPHLLPVAFQDIRAFMSSYSGRNHLFNVRGVPKDVNGFRENCSGIVQPDIYYSKDSIWHGGRKETGFRGPRSLSSLVNSKVSSKSDSSSSNHKTQGGQSQENVSVQTNDIATPTSVKVTPASVKAIPTSDKTIPSSDKPIPTSEGATTTSNTAVPTRKNIHTSPESDFISRTVAAMNAKKLLGEAETAQARLSGSVFDSGNIIDQSQFLQTRASSGEEDVGELKGGSLMRALVHEQDATGNEAKVDIEKFHIMPAGKMIPGAVNKKKTKPQCDISDSFTVQNNFGAQAMQTMSSFSPRQSKSDCECYIYERQNVSRDQCDLRPVIPGGDLAAYSPPKKTRLTEQDLIFLEHLKKSKQVEELDDFRHKIFTPVSHTQGHSASQGPSSYLMNQLLGKSSTYSCTSSPGTSDVSDQREEESQCLLPSSADIDNQSGVGTQQNDGARTTSAPSVNNDKLQSLLQKLNKQSL